MTTVAITPYRFKDSQLVQFFRTAYKASPILTVNSGVMFLCFAACTVLQLVDARTFNGISIWIKPGKFFFSMVVHCLTIAWALSLIESPQRASRAINWSVWVVLITAWGELIYIALRASQGQASHFNLSTPINAAFYQVMAAFAVALVVAPAVIGWKIWRMKRGDIWTASVALGFGLAALLAIIVGMTLGSNSSHWIGGDLTDATGLPIFKWSTTGGDLRVAHFIGLHTMQIVPFAALSGRRSMVCGAAAGLVLLTTLTYLQALSGTPLLRP
jgi:hypothetical protein